MPMSRVEEYLNYIALNGGMSSSGSGGSIPSDVYSKQEIDNMIGKIDTLLEDINGTLFTEEVETIDEINGEVI